MTIRHHDIQYEDIKRPFLGGSDCTINIRAGIDHEAFIGQFTAIEFGRKWVVVNNQHSNLAFVRRLSQNVTSIPDYIMRIIAVV
jgi:hypothetical protein